MKMALLIVTVAIVSALGDTWARSPHSRVAAGVSAERIRQIVAEKS